MARATFGGTSSLLMVIAVAVMGGFLYWLYDQAQSLDERVTPVMEDTASAEGESSVTLAMLRNDPGAVTGQNAALDSVEVASRLGRAVFSLSLDDTLSYPVLMENALIQRGMTVYGGDRVSVTGRIYTFNDSIRGEWLAGGAVDSASAAEVPVTPSFLLADSVDILQ